MCKLMCIEECEDLIGESLKPENADRPPESAESLVNVESDVQVKYADVFEKYKQVDVLPSKNQALCQLNYCK